MIAMAAAAQLVRPGETVTGMGEINPADGTKPIWHVYLAECADGTFYTGISVDPVRRMGDHNAGRGSRYTRTRTPVRLLGSVAVGAKADALRLEKRIKSWNRDRTRAFFEHS